MRTGRSAAAGFLADAVPVAREDLSYGVERYSKQVRRLYGVMDRRFADNTRLGRADYQVEDYIRRDYEEARNHKWYMSARTICLNDLYAFDPDTVVTIDGHHRRF